VRRRSARPRPVNGLPLLVLVFRDLGVVRAPYVARGRSLFLWRAHRAGLLGLRGGFLPVTRENLGAVGYNETRRKDKEREAPDGSHR
jgi:hypothetical protein